MSWESPDTWVWLAFVMIGLLMAGAEILLGVQTGYDLIFTGSALIIAGLIGWPFSSWLVTVIIACALCLIYIILGRKYVHRLTLVPEAKTNVDRLIGEEGKVIKAISRDSIGLVKVGYEEWRARADDEIDAGEDIIVTGIRGVTLTVEKKKKEEKD